MLVLYAFIVVGFNPRTTQTGRYFRVLLRLPVLFVRLSACTYCSGYQSVTYNIQRSLFIFGGAIELRKSMNL